MEHITKKEFIRLVTENRTVFIGISPSQNETENVRKRLKEHSYQPRYAIALSNLHLVFGVEKPDKSRGFINDSHLYLADVNPHTFFNCFRDGDILVVEQEWHDVDAEKIDGYEHTECKYLYYSIVR